VTLNGVYDGFQTRGDAALIGDDADRFSVQLAPGFTQEDGIAELDARRGDGFGERAPRPGAHSERGCGTGDEVLTSQI
jgi:hypothetical protein